MIAAWIAVLAAAAVLSVAWLAGTLDRHAGTRAARRRKLARAADDATVAWARSLHSPRGRSRARGVVVLASETLAPLPAPGDVDELDAYVDETRAASPEFRAAYDAPDPFEISDEEYAAAREYWVRRQGSVPPSLQRVVDAGGRFGLPPVPLRPDPWEALTGTEVEDLTAQLRETMGSPGKWTEVCPLPGLPVVHPRTEPPPDPLPSPGLLRIAPDVPAALPSTIMSPALQDAVAELDRMRDPQPTAAERDRWPWLAPAAWADETGSFAALAGVARG
jgi:hypothetical protein